MNYREIKKVLMITVLEGKGTEEDVYREVKHFVDEETLQEIAVVDTLCNNQPGRDLQNLMNEEGETEV